MASAKQVNDFILEIGPLIQKHAKQRGYRTCSGIIAQACCESAYGTNFLGYKYHNYFGMKCGSMWKGPSVNCKTHEEYKVGKLEAIRDNFRVYGSMEEGVEGYFKFTNCRRYANLKDAIDYREFAKLIKADGWATSSRYTNTIIRIVEQNNLQRFDSFEAPSRVDLPNYVIGKTYTLQSEMRVRTGPGTRFPAKKYEQLTRDGQRHDTDTDGALDRGTAVTCLEIRSVDGETWMRAPSGWICASNGKKVFIK